MNEDIKEKLNHNLERLKNAQDEDKSPITISGYADVIGRGYQLLGDEESANDYFILTVHEHLRARDLYYEKFTGVLLGQRLLECGHALWRINDERARAFFLESLKVYEKEIETSSDLGLLRSLLESGYPLLFLGDSRQAKVNIRRAIEERLKYDVLDLGDAAEELLPYATEYISVHLYVIMGCQQNTLDGYDDVLSKLKDYYTRNEISIDSWHPPIVIRLYDLVVRRVEETKKARGEQING
jgi:hypothetical protein